MAIGAKRPAPGFFACEVKETGHETHFSFHPGFHHEALPIKLHHVQSGKGYLSSSDDNKPIILWPFLQPRQMFTWICAE